MSGQHVGAQSDSVNNEPGGRSPAERLRSVMKATGKTFRGVSDIGDGEMCPVPGHGRMYVHTKRQWCPHSDHDKLGVPRDG